MAFDKDGLRQAAGGETSGGHRIFTYVTAADNLAAVAAAGYFNNHSTKLAVNDFIFVTASDGGGIARVNSNTGGVVDITDAVAINTDSG